MNRIFHIWIASSIVLMLLPVTMSVNTTAHALTGNLVTQDAQTPAEICASVTEKIIEPDRRQFTQATNVLRDNVDYGAVLCTESGPIYLDLFEEEAPLTVNNFVFLARAGYYNHTLFHRVIAGFMAQGGDHTATGGGGPGYQFYDETENGLTFDRVGLLAMANSGPNTNGSQFFITYGLTSWLDGNHTIFGEVIQGIDTAELLTLRDPQQTPNIVGTTLDTVVIIEDPDRVSATPDGPPSVAHLQALLENHIVTQVNALFVLDAETSHTYDPEAKVEEWRAQGGADLGDFMQAVLSDSGFIGTAAIRFTLADCPVRPEDIPIWAFGYRISDYGLDGAAQAIIADDARAERLVESGAYDQQTILREINGRIFVLALPEEGQCGSHGVDYRLEFPYGRYLLVVDLVMDGDIITAEAEMTPEQVLGSMLESPLFQTVGAVLDRGNMVE